MATTFIRTTVGVFIGPPICTLLIGISTAWVLAGRGVLMPRSVNECAVAIRRVRRRFEERPIGIPSRCGLVTLGLPAKRGTVLTHRSREWQKNITIRILLSVKILIEFRPQCPGSIKTRLAVKRPTLPTGRQGHVGGALWQVGTKRCSP